MDLTRFNESLSTYVRPITSPVAIKMVAKEAEIPEKARMPKRDFGVTMPVCQGLALARRHGMIVAMGKEDMLCPLGAVAMGFYPPKTKFMDATFGIPFWVRTQKDAANLLDGMARFDEGRYSAIVAAPIGRAAFDPDVLIVYGNPAQMTRLVQAAVYVTGEAIVSRSTGGLACAEQTAHAMQTSQFQFVLAGGGDRALALTQDDETSFAVPVALADALSDALQATHKQGARYPTRSYLTYGATMPRNFGQLMEYLQEDEE
ncbi:MAG: DUF169 domain-containing protein [Dehalococcoidia bacterium]|nr:DUF169 domain-containing protein [Dehalococcoidia bacterium]